MKLTKEQFVRLTEQMSEKIKPCPHCGKRRQVSAIFESNKTDKIMGWAQWCQECDSNTNVPVLKITELDWKIDK